MKVAQKQFAEIALSVMLNSHFNGKVDDGDRLMMGAYYQDMVEEKQGETPAIDYVLRATLKSYNENIHNLDFHVTKEIDKTKEKTAEKEVELEDLER